MDYKKNELKAHEKTVQANKERKYNKKAYSDKWVFLWMSQIEIR